MEQTPAEAIYNHVVKPLPPSERLKLATLILNDISPRALVDYSKEWTEGDIREFTAYSWNYILQQLGKSAALLAATGKR